MEVVARGVLIADGHILLCRNVKHGYSYLPGGHVDPGESAAHALAREFMEEAALPIRVGGPLAVSENVFTQGGVRHHEVNLVFHVEHPHQPHGAQAQTMRGGAAAGSGSLAGGTDSGLRQVGFGAAPHPSGGMFHVEPQESKIDFWWCPIRELKSSGMVPSSLVTWIMSGMPPGVLLTHIEA